ncbi:MAG: PAS domain-containing protein [Hyphomicrobium sp.]|nr:PAS domain-containing protein [Hyphomicrobium sp.]
MRHKASQHLYDYWNRLRGSRLAPRRFEIEPASIGDALPDTFILERRDAGTFPYRLAGTRLCERFKKEFRGHDFLASWNAQDISTLRSRLNAISAHGGVILLLANTETASGKSLQVEILILPLVHGHVCADRFLGVVSPLTAPSWLGLEPLEAMHLATDEIIWPDGHAQASVAGTDDIDDRQSPFVERIRQSRIVRSDRRQFRVFDGGLNGNRTVASES